MEIQWKSKNKQWKSWGSGKFQVFLSNKKSVHNNKLSSLSKMAVGPSTTLSYSFCHFWNLSYLRMHLQNVSYDLEN